MDDRRIEKIMGRRERGYIWLERELRLNMLLSTLLLLAFFTLMYILSPQIRYFWKFLTGAVVANGIWQYMTVSYTHLTLPTT